MSESVQRDDQWSSLPDMVRFRYDDQHPSLPVEWLRRFVQVYHNEHVQPNVEHY
jgi:hypothetical protein